MITLLVVIIWPLNKLAIFSTEQNDKTPVKVILPISVIESVWNTQFKIQKIIEKNDKCSTFFQMTTDNILDSNFIDFRRMAALVLGSSHP